MTSLCTSASHQIFCPIKCSLESKKTLKLRLKSVTCSHIYYFLHGEWHIVHYTVYGIGSDSDSVNMLSIGANQVKPPQRAQSAPVQRHDSTEWIICASRRIPENVLDPFEFCTECYILKQYGD